MYVHPKLEKIVQRDPRYAYEAYEFIDRALQYTARKLGRERTPDIPAGDPRLHVSGRELLDGIRELVLAEFGMLARTVLAQWGVHRTDDFGNIVYNLIDAGLLCKSDSDDPADFVNAYEFATALD
ncbi:MAG: hypothetical protein NZO58_10810, partial [Gemmataceae bacterium]|nr:hypothetical protein [Gemmataceae bacterium]